jgi:3-hydroxyisobutyrate dehydrogenase-like beta-hydroxyacid dehydrogenase
MRVGFVGLGQMGMPMARHVLGAGFELVVHNRTRARAEKLAAEGARIAESPAEVAAGCDLLLSCLPGPSDVERVYLGPGGAVGAARAGQVLCDMSTIDPETHRRVAAAAAERGAEYLDAPVSGGTSGAREGTLAIMVGGSAAAFELARPVFAAMGKSLYHAGPVGAGATVKLVNQMMGAISSLAAVEGLVLGTKAGVDPELLVEIVSSSSGNSRSFGGMAPNILKRYFEPGFTIDLMHKDVSLAVAMARRLGVRVLAGALAEQVIQEARGAGLGDRATYALVQPLERVAGVEVKGS